MVWVLFLLFIYFCLTSLVTLYYGFLFCDCVSLGYFSVFECVCLFVCMCFLCFFFVVLFACLFGLILFFLFVFVFTLFLDVCYFFNEKEKEMDLCGWGGRKDLGGVDGGEPKSKSSACKRIFKKFLQN